MIETSTTASPSASLLSSSQKKAIPKKCKTNEKRVKCNSPSYVAYKML